MKRYKYKYFPCVSVTDCLFCSVFGNNLFMVLSNPHFTIVLVSIYYQHIIINIIKNLNDNLNFLSNREPLMVFEHGMHQFLEQVFIICLLCVRHCSANR